MFENALALRKSRRIREKMDNPGDVRGAPSQRRPREVLSKLN